MPIDEALDKIEGSEKEESPKKKKKSEAKSADLNEQLLIDAQKCLGEWLVDDYFSTEVKEYKSIIPFLKNAAPYLLKILPGKPSQSSNFSREFLQSVWLTTKLSAELWNFCLNRMNDYLAQTDILSNKTEKEIDVRKEAKECFPEMLLIEKVILKQTTFTKDIVIHPYLIPMAMSPEYRPLIAMTILDSISKKIIKSSDDRSQMFNAATDVIKYAPSLDQIADNAKKYKITELRKIVQELSSALEDYKQKWAWG